MRITNSRWTAAACCAALTLAAALPARGQTPAETKPVVVVAINSYDQLMQDVDYLGGLLQMPNASQMVDAMAANFTGGQGLAGLDKTKPIGLLVDMSMMFPSFAAYLPVTDQSALLALLAPFGITSTDMGNGVLQVNAFGQDAYAKNSSGWMVLGMSPDSLNVMPADPSPLLGELTQQYDVAVQLNMQSLPEPLRQQGLAAMSAAQQGLTKLEGESDADFEARRQALQSQIETSGKMLAELDQVQFGLAIAGAEQKVYLDVNVLALPDTQLATEFNQNGPVTTNFAGFAQPDAAATLSFAGNVSQVSLSQLDQGLGQFRAHLAKAIEAEAKLEQKEPLRAAVGVLLDAVKETLQAGTMDGGAVLNMAPGSTTIVAGGLIADPKKIEEGLKKLAESLAGSRSDALPTITWGAETHGGVTFHTMQLPSARPQQKAMFGEQINVVVGIGPQAAYVAFGTSAADALKKVIDASAAAPGQATKPMQLTMSLGKVIDAIKSIGPPEQQQKLAMASGLLAGAQGNDHVSITSTIVENGQRIRFEVEQGVIQAIATSAMMGGMQASAPAAAPAAREVDRAPL